jgi:hypothetical protein
VANQKGTKNMATKRNEKPSTNGNGAAAGENTASDNAAVPTLSTDIEGVAVTLPRSFKAGDIMNDTTALIVDTFRVRQFTNNQVALAKARAANYAKAENDEERAKYVPLTAEQILAKWVDYMPTIGGTGKVSASEKLRHEAAWAAYVKMVGDHNAAVKAGNSEPVIAKGIDPNGKPVVLSISQRPTKSKDVSAEDHEAAVEAWEAKRENIRNNMLSKPAYAERVQIELDRLMAEKGAAKEKASETATVAADDIL